MKAILKSYETSIPHKDYYYRGQLFYQDLKPEVKQDFSIYGNDIEMDVRMISTNGFRIPDNCDVEVEMKFTFTPKTPKTETVTLK